MTEIKNSRRLLRILKMLLFILCLAALTVTSLVLLVRSGERPSLDWMGISDVFTDNQSPPSLTLEGEDTLELEAGGVYTEPGFSACDAAGQDLSGRVTATLEGDTLLYRVADDSGNFITRTRNIIYVDTTPPELTLTGGETLHISAGSDFTDPGFSAFDRGDGDLTAAVKVSGEVDTLLPGEYSLTYTVSDSVGNLNAAVRKVYVDEGEDGVKVPETVMPEGKTIYLTFDDGPGPYTEELLNVLDRYDVKVTFFVTNQFPDFQDVIGEAYRRGHSIGIHTYSHDFATVYASGDAYYEDLNQMLSVIKEQTGRGTMLVRFPGGSSNTLSSQYCPGIMTQLTGEIHDKGFQYFDWNADSNDAGGASDPETVCQNVIAEIVANGDEPSVVLQHDIKEFSVNAVENIIRWGQSNGYQFLPLTASSPAPHHDVLN